MMDKTVAAAPHPRLSDFSASTLWRKTTFQIVMTACITFVVITLIAMFTYAGGTADNPQNAGYSFFTNFFSDLGRTISYSGQANTISYYLFTFALTFAGLALGIFFIAFTQFFSTPLWARGVSILGSLFGIGAGICFIGVAFTPANLARAAHGQFVLWAFGLFPLAALCYIPVILKHEIHPNRYAYSFIVFAALLVIYFLFIYFGPDSDTPNGLAIQATGQKIIVYSSILSIWYQCHGALHVNATKTL